jgi:CubicO group peptidase (beta-lactamase class C family)
MLAPLLLGALTIAAATPVTPAPLTHVLTATMEHRIDDLGAKLIHDKRTPGLGICVVEDGRIAYARGFGYANLARSARFVPDTEFFIGPVSRQFTAAALLLLAQSGTLKLDDKIVKFVPELTVAGAATIDQLLHHTAGLPDYTKAPGVKIDPYRSTKLADAFAATTALPPAAPPGKQFADNPIDYAIAGLIVERASGITLSDYLQQNVFLPLVMNRTFYAGDTGISPAHATGYTGPPGHFRPAPQEDPAWLFGNGGIVTTLYDLAKWDIGLPLLLRVDAMRTMLAPPGIAGSAAYGYGWVLDSRDGKRYIWDSGTISGFRAMNALLPDDHVAVIVFANADAAASAEVAQPEAIAATVLDIVLPPGTAHVENEVLAKAKEWLERLAGKRIDRTQLTAAFSARLTDALVARENFAAMGKLEAIVPIASVTDGGSTTYEFLVQYAHEHYHYKMTIAADGKIDGLYLEP